MAAASAACVYSVGPRFFRPRRTLAATASHFVSSFSFSQLGFNYLRPRTSVPASRKLFVVRAARTESKGVSLGFRAPDFETQDAARDFRAVCTPEFFLFKKDGRRPFELVYHGQFDDSRPSNNVPVTGRDLSLAIDCVLSGQPVSSVQKPSVGCSIKWNP